MDYENLTKEQLPQEFQERIERFNRLFLKGAGHSFEEDDLYEYEMACIKQALSFDEYLKDFTYDDIEDIIRFENNDDLYHFINKIKDKLPYFDDGHSGNSLSMSWMLFQCYRLQPHLIPYMHGCLCHLVGDKGYYDDRSDIPKKDE